MLNSEFYQEVVRDGKGEWIINPVLTEELWIFMSLFPKLSILIDELLAQLKQTKESPLPLLL